MLAVYIASFSKILLDQLNTKHNLTKLKIMLPIYSK